MAPPQVKDEVRHSASPDIESLVFDNEHEVFLLSCIRRNICCVWHIFTQCLAGGGMSLASEHARTGRLGNRYPIRFNVLFLASVVKRLLVELPSCRGCCGGSFLTLRVSIHGTVACMIHCQSESRRRRPRRSRCKLVDASDMATFCRGTRFYTGIQSKSLMESPTKQ